MRRRSRARGAAGGNAIADGERAWLLYGPLTDFSTDFSISAVERP
jgi:hypothetical protein